MTKLTLVATVDVWGKFCGDGCEWLRKLRGGDRCDLFGVHLRKDKRFGDIMPGGTLRADRCMDLATWEHGGATEVDAKESRDA